MIALKNVNRLKLFQKVVNTHKLGGKVLLKKKKTTQRIIKYLSSKTVTRASYVLSGFKECNYNFNPMKLIEKWKCFS